MNNQKNELGYDEVVDTFVDAVSVAELIQDRLADGAGVDDIFALYPAFPRLLEIYNDRATFWAQFTDLTSEETTAVYTQLGERFGIDDISKVESYVLGAFDVAAETYSLVDHNIRSFQSIRFKVDRLINQRNAA